MSVLAMTLPIPEGELKALEDHIAEAKKRDDFEDTLRGFGLTHESWHVQSTPLGELLIMVFECDDPLSMLAEFSQSPKELPTWQRSVLKDLLGIDLSEPSPEPPSRVIFDWTDK